VAPPKSTFFDKPGDLIVTSRSKKQNVDCINCKNSLFHINFHTKNVLLKKPTTQFSSYYSKVYFAKSSIRNIFFTIDEAPSYTICKLIHLKPLYNVRNNINSRTCEICVGVFVSLPPQIDSISLSLWLENE